MTTLVNDQWQEALVQMANAGLNAGLTNSQWQESITQMANVGANTHYISVKTYGAVGDGTTNDTTAITNAIAALVAAGSGTLYFPPGTYLTTGLVIQSASKFTLRGDYGSILTIAGNTVAAPNQGSANILTIADCTDFSIENLAIDGRRDTLFPLTVLAATATTGQPSVQVANGAGANYVVGQKLTVCGGLTANGGADSNLKDASLVILSITPGVGGANDTITFTTNLTHTYTSGGAALSDGYGPYAAPGAYITFWQTGSATVAGRALAAEDQQNAVHLLNCKRFRVAGCEIHGMWENSIRCGTHLLDGTSQNDGCSYGTISGNVIYHGYDQGVALWCSSNMTVTGNTISAAGWTGISMTLGDDCTVSGNVSSDNVQRIPNDNTAGYGITIEGGARNVVSGNKIKNVNSIGIYLTGGGTMPFGLPADVATTIAAGSNGVALPTATINVASTTGFASAGQVTILSSAGAQQILYTGKTGTSFTGCTLGTGTLFTSQRVHQYPVFLNNAAPLAIGSTSTTVSDGTKFQVNGHYSIIDGPKTERIDVTGIATNVLTLAKPTAFYHLDQCQIGLAVSEGNTISNNAITSPGDAGIRLASAVRTVVEGNVIDQAAMRGIDLFSWTTYNYNQPPCGSVIQANTIFAPNSSNNSSAYQAIAALQCSDLVIANNRCGGAPSTQNFFISLFLQAVADSVVSGNLVADAYNAGMRLDVKNDWPCKRVQVANNVILRCYGEGLIVFGGDSLVVSGNVIEGCAAAHGPAGFGGALDLRGIANCQISKNAVINNGRGGIGLDTASINSVNVFCTSNILEGNIARDDGKNFDLFTGVAVTQAYGIKELSTGQGPNTYINNLVSGNTTNWSLTSTGNTLRGNQNFNPVGSITPPSVPLTTVAYTNILNADCTVFVAPNGATISSISIGGVATGAIAGSFRVPAGQTITLAYTVATPTWTWFGD